MCMSLFVFMLLTKTTQSHPSAIDTIRVLMCNCTYTIFTKYVSDICIHMKINRFAIRTSFTWGHHTKPLSPWDLAFVLCGEFYRYILDSNNRRTSSFRWVCRCICMYGYECVFGIQYIWRMLHSPFIYIYRKRPYNAWFLCSVLIMRVYMVECETPIIPTHIAQHTQPHKPKCINKTLLHAHASQCHWNPLYPWRFTILMHCVLLLRLRD